MAFPTVRKCNCNILSKKIMCLSVKKLLCMRGRASHNSFWRSHILALSFRIHTFIFSHTYILLSHTYILTLTHIHSCFTYTYILLTHTCILTFMHIYLHFHTNVFFIFTYLHSNIHIHTVYCHFHILLG